MLHYRTFKYVVVALKSYSMDTVERNAPLGIEKYLFVFMFGRVELPLTGMYVKEICSNNACSLSMCKSENGFLKSNDFQ